MKLATTVIVFCVCTLVLLGLVSLYSAGMWKDGSRYVTKQSVWLALGLTACVAFTLMDYRLMARLIWVLAPVTLLLLVLPFVPALAEDINGARRWIRFGPVTVQPSELAKLTLIIGLAAYFVNNQRHMGEFKRGLLFPLAGAGVFLVLIFKQNDYGTTLLLACVAGVLLVVAGVRIRHFAPVAAVGLFAFAMLILANPTKLRRIDAWINPQEHLQESALQAYKAMIALGSGGITGVGLGDSRLKLGYIPENHTDFILSVIGEEFGLVGTLTLLAFYVALFVAILAVARSAADPFGFYLAVGIAFLIGLQSFINIGVVTSVLPNKGIALPFVSYGGSSLIVMLSAIGIVLSVALRGEAPVKQKKAAKANPFTTTGAASQFG